MDQPESDSANPFEKEKFDAGIDVDEDEDPKKYIEKLTGKLAQKLRDYNGTEQDVDLNKFVINSLIPAAIPQMGSDDAKDVITKVNDNIGKEADETQPETEEPVPDEIPVDDQSNGIPQMESKKPVKSKIVESETIESLIRQAIGGTNDKKKKGPKNPFKAPTFK